MRFRKISVFSRQTQKVWGQQLGRVLIGELSP
jgi:hypothetical protein